VSEEIKFGIEVTLKRAESLRRSILARAFTGELAS
jgi:hypothetical protein